MRLRIPSNCFSVRQLRVVRHGISLSVLSVACLVSGCSSTAGPDTLNNPALITTASYPAAFDASRAVLRDAGFGVDRQDYRFGKVSSKPKGSPTLIEAWKPDNTYADQALRSTLGDLRRTVTVSFTPQTGVEPEPADGIGQSGYDVRVEVLVERLQVPERRMNGNTRGAVFADLAEVPEELQARGITGRYWQPVGRDIHLEQRLLRDILDRTRADAG